MTSLWRHSWLTYYDLGPNFLTQGMELLPGEVWQVSKRNSQHVRSYLRKTTGGPFAPPPSGARVKEASFASSSQFLRNLLFFLRRVTYFVLAKQIWIPYDQNTIFFLRIISIWRQKVGSLCWKVGLHVLPSYGNSSKKLVAKYPYLFWQYEISHYIQEKWQLTGILTGCC